MVGRTFKSGYQRKSGYGVASAASAARRVLKYGRTLKRRTFRKASKELNYKDTSTQATSAILAINNNATKTFSTTTNSGTDAQYLCAVAQGDDNFNRNGRKVMLKSLQIKWNLNIKDLAATANLTKKLRVIVFQDHEHSRVAGTYILGTAASTDDGLLANTGATLTTNDFPNVDNQKRFRILRDFTWNIGEVNTAGMGPSSEGSANQQFTGDWYIPLNNVAEWDQFDATQCSKNGIFMIGIADGNVSTTNCELDFKARLRFYEM